MARSSELTPDQKKALLDAYACYKTVQGAARAVGVSRWQAARYLKRVGADSAPIVAQHAEVVQHATASLYSTREALQANYDKLLALEGRAGDRPPTSWEIGALTGLYR